MASRMDAKRLWSNEAVELLQKLVVEKPLLPSLIPVLLFAWTLERWLLPSSSWIPLLAAVWASFQYGRFQRRLLAEDLNKRLKQLMLNATSVTPMEPCEWLNKLVIETWPNYIEPKTSAKFFSLINKRLKERKPKLMENVEVQEVSLGSCPPVLGREGIHWLTFVNRQFMRLGFDWSSNEMSVMFLAKLAKPLIGTARIVINSIHIKGELILIPILHGQAVLYSFESTPEVRVGVTFGGGGNLPATELPGVSSWLVKVLTETIEKMAVEPRRLCFPLPPTDLRKKAVGGIFSVTVLSASNVGRAGKNGDDTDNCQSSSGSPQVSGRFGRKKLRTFVEINMGHLMRKTSISEGSDPVWDSTFNMVLHGESGILKFLLYESDLTSVKFNYMTSCEIKMKYVADGSTIFWAIGHESDVIAEHCEHCGKEVEMVVPFEDALMGELKVILVLKEWQFADGSIALNNSSNVRNRNSQYGTPDVPLKTGRKLKVTVVEGRNFFVANKSGRFDPYIKLQYDKALYRTRVLSHTTNPVWNQLFEFDEIEGGDNLKIKCYLANTFADESIGSARVNLSGLVGGSSRDFWIPLEKVSSGELRLQIEAEKNDEGSQNAGTKVESRWIELVILEGRDLVAADLGGTSDPFVRVQYGDIKRRTKVIYKTLNPRWNQTLEFPDSGKPLVLYVKDHNAILPTSSIGHCTVEYDFLPANQTADKWIPLQGVKSGEIHVKITRRVPERESGSSAGTDVSSFSKAHALSLQTKDILKKFRNLLDDGDLEGLEVLLSEAESFADTQGDYILQLEREKALLLSKISDLGREITRTASSPN